DADGSFQRRHGVAVVSGTVQLPRPAQVRLLQQFEVVRRRLVLVELLRQVERLLKASFRGRPFHTRAQTLRRAEGGTAMVGFPLVRQEQISTTGRGCRVAPPV